MKLSKKEEKKLIKQSKRASNLLIQIINKELPNIQEPTEEDIEFRKIITQIYQIHAPLSEIYVSIYNQIQRMKISPQDQYYKQLRKR
jgi:hypothetical protein